MTRSWRSRAIRSRSSYRDSRWASARLAASSSATPAWAAKGATTSACVGGNGGAPDLAHRPARGRGGPLVGGEVGGRYRFSGGEHPPGQGLAGRQDQAARGVRAV